MSRSSASAAAARAWIVAASIAAVEALKDQGFCRWNYTLRSLHQHTKSKISSSYSQAATKLSASSGVVSDAVKAQRRMRRPEESHRKVMELSCWGPESTRF
ncbi:uncharacterized protein LOC116192249 [Punica granatum]|uniref:Wound-responsive family protein n=2 Tax=Punica granatum TaxID=22663 RepID=A0A218X8U7_PUNGR|nr:uncharacterized protein LOC116192249 [Punica granatum]OWM81208.1 hypothetical protein CDL15_Pgr007239 [Punica granatum]PKI51149.1 hypothetical protein CRG98_028436 [Punica granatum]